MTVRVPKPTLKLTPSVSTDGQLGSQCSQRGQSSESSRRMFGQRASVEKPAPAAAAPEMALTAAASTKAATPRTTAKAATKLQAFERGHVERKQQAKQAAAATKLQALERGHMQRARSRGAASGMACGDRLALMIKRKASAFASGVAAACPWLVGAVRSLATSVQATAAEWEALGYTSGFRDFQSELMRPFKASTYTPGPNTRTTCLDTLSFCPRHPRQAFILWNVLCFWVGVLDLLLVLLLEHGLTVYTALLGLVDGLLGFLFAYTFYFLFVTTGPRAKLWMLRGLLIILSYVLATGLLTYLAFSRIALIKQATGETYREVMMEIGLEGAKCASNVLVLYHALLIYCAQPSDAPATISSMV